MAMRIKMLLTFDFDPETGEYTPISSEVVSKDESKVEKKAAPKKKKTVVTEIEGISGPAIVLEDNKYCLNQEAADALGVVPEDRIDIKYEQKGKVRIPVIGSNDAFGTKGGNKLTQSLTVSCRGKANEMLSEYGTRFELQPHPSKDGLFILVGDKPQPEPVETKEIKIDIEDEPIEDLPLDESIGGMLVDEDNTKEITTFDFTLK